MTIYILSSMVLALAFGCFGGFWAARAYIWQLEQRQRSVEGFLRASAAREGKKAQKERVEEILRGTGRQERGRDLLPGGIDPLAVPTGGDILDPRTR
jgi:uncharacterized protein YneF (UPF0154 family)